MKINPLPRILPGDGIYNVYNNIVSKAPIGGKEAQYLHT